MLREFLSFCLPLLLHTPLPRAGALLPIDETQYRWSFRVFRWAENRWLARYKDYGGRVIALSEDTITVQLWGRIPRTFPVALPLISDRVPFEHGFGRGYRLRDVRVGDYVDLDTVPVRDGFVCVGIGIFRRPGGVIPPGDPDPGISESGQSHHFFNKCQFVEERVSFAMGRLMLRSFR